MFGLGYAHGFFEEVILKFKKKHFVVSFDVW